MNEIALVVMTNGRDRYLKRTLESARSNLLGRITTRVLLDDSTDPAHTDELRGWLPPSFRVHHGGGLGFSGACARLWQLARELKEPYVFWLEDDFTFNRLLHLNALAAVLDVNPRLSQLALRRQPWNEEERRAGGIVEQRPDTYTERVSTHAGHAWLEHTNFWTTNPSLIPRHVIERFTWPPGAHSEGHFGIELREAGMTFGYWGTRASGEWVTHIGDERTGSGY